MDKIEKELKENIKIFDQAYKDWNNEKLSVEKVDKAQKIVDGMVDEYTDSHISKMKLKYYRLGKQFALQDESEREENDRLIKEFDEKFMNDTKSKEIKDGK